MLTSVNPKVQEKVPMFIVGVIAATKNNISNNKENAKYFFEAGAIPILVNRLSSPLSAVAKQSAMALSKIALHFPKEVLKSNALPPLIKNLKSDDEEIRYTATFCLVDISREVECHDPILKAGGIKALMDLLKCGSFFLCTEVINAFNNLAANDLQTSQHLLDLGIFKFLKKFSDAKT
uniref:Uncharacterized protein n=1 Tax=Panagrolaimus sp. ES5 TaxID=591445 RepID=A0AC34GK15_9BILA